MARTRVMAGTRSAPSPGVQGTLGGPAPAVGARPGKRIGAVGDEMYLWVLVLAEVGAIAWLRASFSRYHGG